MYTISGNATPSSSPLLPPPPGCMNCQHRNIHSTEGIGEGAMLKPTMHVCEHKEKLEQCLECRAAEFQRREDLQ